MQTFKFPSRSSGAEHTVKVTDDDRVICSCRGFDTPNRCWHYREVCDKLGIPTRGRSSTPSLLTQLEDTVPELPSLAQLVNEREELNTTVSLFVEPMLASALPEGMTIDKYGDEWVLEEKYDGHRMIVHKAHGTGVVVAWARSGIVRILPRHIINCASLLPPGTYDGELYCPGHTSTDVIRIDRQHRLRLVLFDILRIYDPLPGEHVSCMTRPGHERRLLLEQAVSLLNGDSITIAPQYRVSEAGLKTIWDAGGEGAVIKHRDEVYSPGKRVKRWVKFKKQSAAEVTVTGFKAGKYGPQSVIVGVDKDGVEVQVKSRNDDWRAKFAQAPEDYIGQVLVISYQEKTRDGRYRHPMADHFLNFEME